MTELEDTLARVLAAEADRHEPPAFSAHRVAEAATARRRVPRRPLVALAAAAIGAAGVGGAVAAAGGGHHGGGRVSVTFQTKTGTVGSQVTDASVKAWVDSRAEAEGLKGVTAKVRHGPWRLTVTGHAADLDQLKTLGVPGVVQFRPVVYVPTAAPTGGPPQSCAVSIVRTGNAWRACDQDGKPGPWITDPLGIDYHVAAAQAFPLDLQMEQPWGVQIRFDAAGTKAFDAFTAEFREQMIAPMIDGAVYGEPAVGARAPKDYFSFTFTGDGSADRARLLAAILSTQGPADLDGATVTVTR